MNYQPQGLFQGMSQEDMIRIYQMIQQRQQQQPMLTGPMMLAQANTKQPNAIQRIFGGPSDVMSPKDRLAYCQADPEGVGCERFRDVNKPAPATPYSLGSDAPGQKSMEQRQRNASAAKLGLPPGKDYSDDEILAATLRKRLAPR